MPGRRTRAAPTAFQNFTGGGYFFLDRQDRIWSATKTSHLVVLAERDDGDAGSSRSPTTTSRRAERRRAGHLGAARLRAAASGSSPRRAARSASSTRGRAGSASIAPRRGDRELVRGRPGRASTSSPTSACTGFSAARRPHRASTGRSPYRTPASQKPGQVDAGSGTTPTIMARRLRRDHRQRRPDERRRLPTGDEAAPRQTRTVCEVPVFAPGASATENSLIAIRPLADRGEQLRLPGPVRARTRRR